MQADIVEQAKQQLFEHLVNAIADFSVKILNESTDTEKAMEMAGKVLSNSYKIKHLVDDIINE